MVLVGITRKAKLAFPPEQSSKSMATESRIPSVKGREELGLALNSLSQLLVSIAVTDVLNFRMLNRRKGQKW